jgi:hypothetical protein
LIYVLLFPFFQRSSGFPASHFFKRSAKVGGFIKSSKTFCYFSVNFFLENQPAVF